MENADRSEAATDWRQAWRAFADKVGGRPEGAHDEAAQALQAKLQETRAGSFQGFRSPPGRF